MAFNPTYAAIGDNKVDVYGATLTGVWSITFGGSDTYLTGGLALVAATFGLSRPIAGMIQIAINTAAIVANALWNSQTSKLQLQEVNVGLASTPAPFQELPNTTSIANFAYTFLIITQR